MSYAAQLEQASRNKGLIASVVMHALLILAILFAPMAPTVAPPLDTKIEVKLPPDLGIGGKKVALGLPNQGQGSKASPGKPDPNAGTGAPAEVEKIEKPKPVPPKTSKPLEPVIRKTTTPTPPKPVVTEDPAVVEAKRQEVAAKKAKEEARVKEQEATREAERQAAEAKAKSDAIAKAKADAKGKYGGRFGNGKGDGSNGGGGTGEGRGNTGTPGNQGVPDGDPNSDKLTGVSGSGKIGGGLGNRKVVAKPPKIEDDSQKNGSIVLKICVDAEGNVISAEFTIKGSTTSDSDLVQKAITNAKKYKFSTGSNDTECGTVTYDFRVK
jgi:outer membrane biosynthesis protein TonB